MTRGQVTATDVAALLRARNPLLWVITREEARVERHLIEAASSAGYVSRTWDVAAGVTDIAGKAQQIGSADPGETLAAIRDRASRAIERGVWIMRDLPIWLGGPPGASVQRQLRNLARTLPSIPREGAIPAGFRSKQHSTQSISPPKKITVPSGSAAAIFGLTKLSFGQSSPHACSPPAKEVVSLRSNFCGWRRGKSPACRRNSTRKATHDQHACTRA
jgi:hypothetical protein